eukprot:568941-Hanusia_phi.AAC.2
MLNDFISSTEVPENFWVCEEEQGRRRSGRRGEGGRKEKGVRERDRKRQRQTEGETEMQRVNGEGGGEGRWRGRGLSEPVRVYHFPADQVHRARGSGEDGKVQEISCCPTRSDVNGWQGRSMGKDRYC